MAASRRFTNIFSASLIIWICVMGVIYYAHYVKKVDEELGYFSSDIVFDTEARQYYGIYNDSRKIGYKNESQITQKGMKILREDGTVKLNLAGMSREVFISSITGIDSTLYTTKYMEFSIHSGEHRYNFTAKTVEDSLIIYVKNSILSKWSKGFFIVEKTITLPVALPFYFHNSQADSLRIQVFDPVDFSLYIVHSARKGNEILQIDDLNYEVVRYDLEYNNRKSTLWLDEYGRMVKSEGYLFFSDVAGSLRIEKAMDKNVFLLPLEVSIGKDILNKMTFVPPQPIPYPRGLTYLEVEFSGLRAANVDISASNKEVLSKPGWPLLLGIHAIPVAQGHRLIRELETVAQDTTVYGMSDYIHPYDARIRRMALEIIEADKDTLKMAYALNQWVFINVRKEKGLDIVRSIDILKNMRGGANEHTKLFTALARSVGILTQINMGLVYDDGAFRYHSWPSVFVDRVWYNLDPWYGQDTADATHITLVRGGFDKLVELLRLQSKISLKIHSYR